MINTELTNVEATEWVKRLKADYGKTIIMFSDAPQSVEIIQLRTIKPMSMISKKRCRLNHF